MNLRKWTLIAAAGLAIVAGALSNRLVAQAQAAEPQTYVIQAGTMNPQNVEVLAFAPQTLQVHRGDTVTWVNNSFHDIHFETAPVPLVLPPDGNNPPVINPAAAFRTIDSGSTYKGGDANSGLPMQPSDRVFSLMIDLPPGTYSYMCDVHPGMVGIITVVADGTAIPSPSEAELQGSAEFASANQTGADAGLKLEAQLAQAGAVQAGSGDTGRATVNQFFPLVTTVKAGESVTFTNPQTSIEPHTISWPPARNQEVNPQPVDGGPPTLLLGATLAPMTQSGASVGVGDPFSSGLILPGQSFTLTFTAPGTYAYTCNIHPGMNGVIVVQAAS